ncbi:hypothetical protein B0A50_00712 [Salinomyces thailandicus]|uniref:TATA-box-binding protein n=1 Tax=Salinomyces thailandicus TaxID=706561 RepID=A0A4V5N8A4_9PEZI|nr:hypothetical protein B0A50_00712 [Salinomyces thailandica]
MSEPRQTTTAAPSEPSSLALPANPTTTSYPPFTGTGPTISNVVCGMNLNCLLDLKSIALHCRNASYNPKRFPAVVLRIRNPKATALVFARGKLQVLGCKSPSDAHLAGRKFARMIQKCGHHPRLTEFTVQNMVANADTRILIRLEGLHAKCVGFTEFEPELFPGLVFRMVEPRVTLLVFARGKVVFLGARRREELEEAVRKVWPLLLEFRMGEVGFVGGG